MLIHALRTVLFVVTKENLAIVDDPGNLTGKPGKDDNADFGVHFAVEDGSFCIFAHLTVEYWEYVD